MKNLGFSIKTTCLYEEECEEYCEKYDGHMAVINNAEENEALYDYVRRTLTVPDGVDAGLLEKVISNPEMLALLASLAKAAGNLRSSWSAEPMTWPDRKSSWSM